MEQYKDRIKQAETRIFKVVFPHTTNHYNTLFGGTAMYLMDEAAFMTATRFSRKKVVTVSSSKIDFTEPIPADTIIELVGTVIKIGNTSMEVQVEIFQENMYDHNRKKSITGTFTFVAIDKNGKAIKIT